jgi:hypothetical protein
MARHHLTAAALIACVWASLFGCKRQNEPPPYSSQVKPSSSQPIRDQSHHAEVATPSPASAQAAREPENNSEQALQSYFAKKLKAEHGSDANCPGRAAPIEIVSEAYGDLDGDGQDEVAVTAMSCYAGQLPDLSAVLKLGPGDQLTEMPFAKHQPKVFPHMNPKADAHGALATTIENGRLVDAQGIYKPGDPNCCPTGGTRRYYHRWNGKELVLEDVVDAPDPAPVLKPNDL